MSHLEGYRGVVTGADRKRRLRSAAARHLRRADGFGVSLQQVRRPDSPRPLGPTWSETGRTGYARTGAAGPTRASGKSGEDASEFLYSRLMCWVAVDRGLRLAHKRSFPAPVERWHKVRDDIYAETASPTCSGTRQRKALHPASSGVDKRWMPRRLLMPLVKFIGPTDPRWLSHVAGDRARARGRFPRVSLQASADAASDGLQGEEGTFSMC